MIPMAMKQTRDQHEVVNIVRFDHIAIPTSTSPLADTCTYIHPCLTTPAKNILGCKIFSGFIIKQKNQQLLNVSPHVFQFLFLC